jgi:hypothetical protein
VRSVGGLNCSPDPRFWLATLEQALSSTAMSAKENKWGKDFFMFVQ